jgi:iron complex transport system substrate-binding protein
VGRSHECDFPAWVTKLPVCTSPKFNVEGMAYEIDQRVKAILQEGLAVYRVDAGQLERLKPDVIITQTQCEVCAVSLNDVEEAVCTWVHSRPAIVSLQPDSLQDVWADIGRVAEALDAGERGRSLVRALQERMTAIGERAERLAERPAVACIEWTDPLMAAGNWMPELVELAGGRNLFGEAGTHSPKLRWDDLRARDPDVIFVSPCGWDIEKCREEMSALTRLEGWDTLAAVRNGRVVLTDGNQFFNRPGPRLVESLEILAEVLHPAEFAFGHEGRDWVRFT